MKQTKQVKSVKGNGMIIGLILVVLVLGFMVYQKYSPKISITFNTKEEQSQTKKPAQTSQGQTSQQFLQVPEYVKDLTSDEQNVLIVPAPDASKEKKTAHFELALKLAKEADVLDMQNCMPVSPLVIKLKEGAKITVTNSGTETHKIVFNKDNSFDIPSGSTQTLDYEFKNGPGLYGFFCDQIQYPAGFVIISPSPSQ